MLKKQTMVKGSYTEHLKKKQPASLIWVQTVPPYLFFKSSSERNNSFWFAWYKVLFQIFALGLLDNQEEKIVMYCLIAKCTWK